MHKDAIQNSQKLGLLNLVKSRIGAKAVSKSTKMLRNWKNQVGNLLRNGKTNNTCFYLEKRREDYLGKKTRQLHLV